MTIYCIGRNFADHAKELGNEVPSSLVVFTKPESSIRSLPRRFQIPRFSKAIHYEVELVLKIGNRVECGQWAKKLGATPGREPESEAARALWSEVSQVAVGIDWTARDVQDEAKKKGLPWTIAKGFDQSGSIGNWLDSSCWSSATDQMQRWKLELKVEGQVRQSDSLQSLLFSVPRILLELNAIFELKPGDCVFTGTPAGVGAVQTGQRIQASFAVVSANGVRAQESTLDLVIE
jgi:acylpyruvate hydrolase